MLDFSRSAMSEQPIKSWWTRAIATLSEPVDGASLAVFRFCFGLLVAYEVAFKFRVGKVRELYAPALHFKYYFFEWVAAPNRLGAFALHYALIGLALLVAAGVFYRASSALLCVLLSYYFLTERTLYINHIYLYCLLAGIMAAVPAHNMLSVDARYGWFGSEPAPRGRAPRWSIWLLRFQMGVVYSYAGLAKLNGDWLRGSPLNLWLPARLGTDHWLLFDGLPLVMSWGGAAFDLLITPLLLWKKTRRIGLAWAVAFHVMNANIFGIASFPWMSLALTGLFFEPDWPRHQFTSLRGKPRRITDPKPLGTLGACLLLAYLVVQIALPMRPWFYPGNSSWTEEGHEFSWHMMLRSKAGVPTFYAQFAQGPRFQVDPLEYVTKRQLLHLAGRPALVHQLARFIADRIEQQTSRRPRVFVDLPIRLNGREPELLVDPAVDLASEPRGIGPDDWIMPAPQSPPGSARSRFDDSG